MARQAFAKKLGSSSALCEGGPSEMRTDLLHLPVDVLVHTMNYLTIDDIKILDIAVMDEDFREVFLYILRDLRISFQCKDDLYDFATAYKIQCCLPWIISRGVRVRNFELDFEYGDEVIPPETLSSLSESNFEMLEDLNLRDYDSASNAALVAPLVAKINERCRSLERLALRSCDLEEQCILDMLVLNPCIHALKLSHCLGNDISLQDIIGHCEELEIFIFRKFQGTLGPAPPAHTVISTHSSLTCVSIDYEYEEDSLSFHDEHLRYIADIASNLVDLEICYASALTTEAYEYMGSKCTQVHTLSLHQYELPTQSPDFNLPRAIANFLTPQLKVLTLDLCTDTSSVEQVAEFARLIEARGHWLETLTLSTDARCAPVFGAIISGCPRLNYLNLRGSDLFAEAVQGTDQVFWRRLSYLRSEGALSLAQLANVSVFFPLLRQLCLVLKAGECMVHLVKMLTSCFDLQDLKLYSHGTPMVPLSAADMVVLAAMETTQLKELILSMPNIDTRFAQLVLYRCPLLQTLLIHCNLPSGILEDSLALTIATHCPLLRELIIEFVNALSAEDVMRMFALLSQVISYSISIAWTNREHCERQKEICRSLVVPLGKTFYYY